MDFVAILQDYGFPMVAAVAMAYFIYFIYTFITTEIKVKLGEANTVLIALIDRIRMLDNDMIRLNQKINMILEFKEQYEKLTGKSFDLDLDEIEDAIAKTKRGKKSVSKK